MSLQGLNQNEKESNTPSTAPHLWYPALACGLQEI